MPYIVFHHDRIGRFGSVPLTADNLAQAHRLMHLSLIQRDTGTGTEHYRVLGMRKAGR